MHSKGLNFTTPDSKFAALCLTEDKDSAEHTSNAAVKKCADEQFGDYKGGYGWYHITRERGYDNLKGHRPWITGVSSNNKMCDNNEYSFGKTFCTFYKR